MLKILLTIAVSLLATCCSAATVNSETNNHALTGDVQRIDLGHLPEEGMGDAIDHLSFFTVDSVELDRNMLHVSVWRRNPSNKNMEVFPISLQRNVPFMNIVLDKDHCLQMVWKIEQGNIVLYSSSEKRKMCHVRLKVKT